MSLMDRVINRSVNAMSAFPHTLLALAARVSIGMVFWLSGRTKVEGWNIFELKSSAVFLFKEEYKIPLLDPTVAAHLAALGEHILPLMLFIGLGSRFAALGLLAMTAVIGIFVYPGAWVEHTLWASVLLLIIKYGPGALSLDHLIARRSADAPASQARYA